MYSPGLELMTPESRGRRSNHFAMEDSRSEVYISYLKTIDIYNKFQHGQNWVKAVGTLCLSAYIVKHEEFRGKKCRNCQNELARLSALRCPLI